MSVEIMERTSARFRPSNIETGRRLRALRLSRRCSQEVLAESVGVSYQQLQKWETGQNAMSVERLKAVCSVFGVAFSYFVSELSEGEQRFVSVGQVRNVKLLEAFAAIRDASDRALVVSLAQALAEKSTKCAN